MLWFPLEFSEGVPRGSWLELAYRSSFFDPLTRPLLRFQTPKLELDLALPAPVFGRAVWIGHVPDDTLRVFLSPGHAQSDAAFVLEWARRVPFLAVLRTLLRRNLPLTTGVVVALLTGRKDDARSRARWILNSLPFSAYDEWRASRIRSFDIQSLDRPRIDWRLGPRICVVVDLNSRPLDVELSSTLDSLTAQAYPNWHVVLCGQAEAASENSRARKLAGLGRATLLSIDHLVSDLPLADRRGLVTVLQPGDVLPIWSLALVAQFASDHPAMSVVYGDEEQRDRWGRYCNPEFKPDWSPVFQDSAGYLGRAVFYANAVFDRYQSLALAKLPEFARRAGVATVSTAGVGHLRRVLLTKPSSAAACGAARSTGRRPTGVVESQRTTITGLMASIVIPTRDRADLLSACLASLSKTRGGAYEVIIVDNGSTEPLTEQLYDRLRKDARYRILRSPGPFNFSRLSNLGAAAARAPTLVFLNNDIVVLSDDWLEILVDRARSDDVGAVGARLLYPSGRLQHGGVVLGLYGVAGHCDIGADRRQPGYLGGLIHSREVSAVTGACLAVAKAKFEAVAGFDEAGLPVDLNDIDLCLRLAERGWRTIYAAAAELIHRESATRGRIADHAYTYRHEIAHFLARWRGRLHDDPFFHPALCLTASRTMLG